MSEQDAKLKLERDVSRGVRAEAILEDPLVVEAMVMIRGALLSQFEQTKFGDTKERDEIWRKLQVCGWFEDHFKRVMQTGRMAEKSLLEKVKSRFTR